MESGLQLKNRFTVRALPWLVAAGALAFYSLTLNHWVSLGNLPQVGRITGWTWQPELLSPAYFVATYPLHWLPAQWVPLALNIFSALCAVLTLGLLARSVALLPHDRTHEQRQRERSDHALLSIRWAWVPPVVATLACGMQLTFWEHATNGSVEMFDLLLFAYVIRALLEFRIDGRDSWLWRAALVYGAGMTNNFAMWGFLPVFIAAVGWIRGLSFFNLRFLLRMALCGLLGLSLYLLLPLLANVASPEPVNFWQGLKVNLAMQKNILMLYPKLPTHNLENLDWTLLVVICVLPILLFSIRWPSYFGDTSKLGILLATTVFHFMFGLYLCVCLWTLLDAPFSPRFRGLGIAFLTFYYLAALSVGYFIGYFLLVFRNLPARGRLPAKPVRVINRLVFGVVVVLAVTAPAILFVKNFPHVGTTNGPMLKDYAAALAQGLPPSGLLLSDDPRRLLITQSWLARSGRSKDFLLLDTQSLPWPAYHRFLHRTYPQKWEATADATRQEVFDGASLVRLMTKLAGHFDIGYLHPSFGYYFEQFYSEPHGLGCLLKQYGTNSLLPPPLTPQLLQTNESFWAKLASQELKPVLAVTAPRAPGAPLTGVERACKKLKLRLEKNPQAVAIGAYYSRALNDWAVELQKSGDLEKAAEHFELAQQLNPENTVTRFNLEYNQNLRAGNPAPLEIPSSVEDRFGKLRTWDKVLSEYGAYDEPGFCYAQGDTFLRGGLYRQAAQCFDRVRTFSPGDISSRLWLAQLNLMARQPDQTLKLIQEIREHPARFPLNSTNRTDLVALEAKAHFARNEPGLAEEILQSALDKSPDNQYLLVAATSAYFENGRHTNALATVERHLMLSPDNPALLLNKGVLYMQMNLFDRAIQPLDRVLTLQPTNYTALFYRAICCLRSDQLEAAQRDYQALLEAFPSAYKVHYGLGEIGYRRHDTNMAIRHYEAYLTNNVPNTDEVKLVRARLAELKGERSVNGSPKTE